MTTVSKDFIVKNGIIVSNTITSTDITTTSAGGGSLYLNGSNNRIDFNNSGVSAPTFTTISTGTKIVLYPNVGAAAVDYALGIESGTMWSSVPTSANQFKWYAGTTSVASLSGTGTFSTTNISYTGTLTGSTGVLNIGSGQLYKDASGNVGIGTASPTPTNASTIAPKLVVTGAGVVNGIQSVRTGGGGGGGAQLILSSTKGADANTYTALVSSEGIGTLSFNGSDGTRFIPAATIVSQVDGAVSTDNVLGRLVFGTSAGGANSVIERMRIDSSGNVGIGTSSPAYTLDVKGTSRLYSASAGANFINFGASRANDYIFLEGKAYPQAVDGYTLFGMRAYSSLVSADVNVGNIQWAKEGSGTDNKSYFNISTHSGTSAQERMRIDSSGNVGIGTSSPSYKLHVRGSATGALTALQIDNSSTAGIGNQTYLNIFTFDGSQYRGGKIYSSIDGAAWTDARLTLQSQLSGGAYDDTLTLRGGNVGIGTATPAQKLSVAGVIESTTGGVKFPDGTTQTSALSDNIYTVTGITGTAATITVDFSLVYSNAIIITLPTGTTSATINFININSKATSGMLFAFSIILSHVTALTATTSVVWRFGAAATSGSLPKWTGNIVPPSTVAANAIDIWSFFSYDVGTSLVGSLSMADIRNA